MSRIRFYECPDCNAFEVTPMSRGKYRCSSCKKVFDKSDIKLTVYKDASGDIVTDEPITGVDGTMENEILETVRIHQMYKDIVAVIPPAVRDRYPENDKLAAVYFYKEHRSLFEND